MGKAFLITADLPKSGTRHLSREGDPGRDRCPPVTPVWFLWLVGEGSGMLRSRRLVMRSEFWEALGYFVSPTEGCPGPSLGNIPRILWLVRGRGCPSSEAWSGGGLHYVWYLVQRVDAEEELGPGWVGSPAVCGGLSPSAGASWAVVCGVGYWGICKRNGVLRWRCLGPAASSAHMAAAGPIVLGPCAQIRWLQGLR